MENLYTMTQVATRVYNISENITERPIKFSQQLVVGTKRAAMIDAGFGIDRDLLTEIRKITNLPLICLLTHGDPDHTGGAELFDRVYLNPADDAVMKAGFDPRFRLHAIDVASGHNAQLVAHMQADEPQDSSFDYLPVADGDTFDLGNTTLTAVAMPGHSAGSMAYVDVARRLGFTGDSLATLTMSELYDARCPSLTTWQTSLVKLKQLVGDNAKLFSGHRVDAFPEHVLSTLIQGVAEIKATAGRGDLPITQMPTGPVTDSATMQPRSHRIADTPFVVMYNAHNL
ncbi:MBL fold metallo-hydrolase [Lacticaseibacillus nasuensis]|uniref:MBL fold metallo-hydrolase n=1 Tax=Lacticaseibacillus nasuensis TaxID=944671 RepID=UPI002246315F|nr:MBL fold metallo-hydrolase [Lacticaseibacillus nasuensis]MCX2456068.1 MBL fold metallo-hydrolase [Lacticaseibacillus nasuensis]